MKKFFEIEGAKSIKYFSHMFLKPKKRKETSELYIQSRFSIVALFLKHPVVLVFEYSLKSVLLLGSFDINLSVFKL